MSGNRDDQIERLRRHLEHTERTLFALVDALRDLPEVPSPPVLKQLGSISTRPEDRARGLVMQRQFGFDAIPPVSECEYGAGVWFRLRSKLAEGGGGE